MRARLPWYPAVFAWLLSCNLLLCAHSLASTTQIHAQPAEHAHHNSAHTCCDPQTSASASASASADQCCQQDTQLQNSAPDLPPAHFTYHYQLAADFAAQSSGQHVRPDDTFPPPVFLSSLRLRI